MATTKDPLMAVFRYGALAQQEMCPLFQKSDCLYNYVTVYTGP